MRATILAIVLLAGCAQQGGTATWRDLQANGDAARLRDGQAFEQDRAQCDYELAQAQNSTPYRPVAPVASGQYSGAVANLGTAVLSGPPPNFFERCMRARGWQLVGY